LGIGDWGLGPIPNPQSPIPKNNFISFYIILLIYKLKNKLYKWTKILIFSVS